MQNVQDKNAGILPYLDQSGAKTGMIGAADMSYGPESGHRFMSIVIGEEEDLEAIYSKLGVNNLHMNKFDRKRKIQICSELKLKGTTVKAWCVKINPDIKKMIPKNRRGKRLSLAKMYQKYNTEVLRTVRDGMRYFCQCMAMQ